MPEPSLELDSAHTVAETIPANELVALAEDAKQIAKACAWLNDRSSSRRPIEIYRKSLRRLKSLERELYAMRSGEPSEDLRWIYDNVRLVHAETQDLRDGIKNLGRLPAVRTAQEEAIPRCVVLARGLLAA